MLTSACCLAGSDRKYFMLGGKGGVGKTSCSGALAMRFAGEGRNTLVVSTDPAHSLSDAFDQVGRGGRQCCWALQHIAGAISQRMRTSWSNQVLGY